MNPQIRGPSTVNPNETYLFNTQAIQYRPVAG